MTSNQRLLGSAENVFMQTSQQSKGDVRFGHVLHLQGPYISLELLSTAVRHLQHRHPVLRSRLQLNPTKANHFLLEEDQTLRLTIREIARNRADHMNFWLQEWRIREKETTPIGQGLAQFWLLQDPNDIEDDKAPRELVIICEHGVSDGLSLSTVAHELLIALSNGDNDPMFSNSLNWPLTMEMAIRRTLSIGGKIKAISRLLCTALHSRITNRLPIARVPLNTVNFALADMPEHCHTEICYGKLSKEETQSLIQKCRSEGVTVTSAVSSAIIYAIASLLNSKDNQPTAIHTIIGADTRRRCVPPVPNHDLSYHVSAILPFVVSTRDLPTSWQLARSFGSYVKKSIDTNQILAVGMFLGKIGRRNIGPPNLAELPTCGISSWGILPFREQYGQWDLVSVNPLINMVRGIMPFIVIQTVNGVLTIMFTGADPVLSLDILENLRNETMKNIRQMMTNN